MGWKQQCDTFLYCTVGASFNRTECFGSAEYSVCPKRQLQYILYCTLAGTPRCRRLGSACTVSAPLDELARRPTVPYRRAPQYSLQRVHSQRRRSELLATLASTANDEFAQMFSETYTFLMNPSIRNGVASSCSMGQTGSVVQSSRLAFQVAPRSLSSSCLLLPTTHILRPHQHALLRMQKERAPSFLFVFSQSLYVIMFR